MYIDKHHLSTAGSLLVQPLFEALFDRVASPMRKRPPANEF